MPGRVELDVTYAARRPWAPRRSQFAAWAGAALSGAAPSRGTKSAEPRATSVHVSIRVVGKARSRGLNARYRHKDRATNVLSFSGAGMSPEGRPMVALVMSKERAFTPEAARKSRAAASEERLTAGA